MDGGWAWLDAEAFRALFAHSVDGVLFTDPSSGEILAANPAACRLLLHDEDDLRRLGRDGIADPEDQSRWAAALAERARSGSVREELSFRRGDGTQLLAEVTSGIFTDTSGELRNCMILHDVTERRAAERSEARFRRLIETSAEAFIAVDAGGLITEWNHQAEVTFGWSRAEAVGRSLVDTIIPPDDPGSQTAGLARSLAARKAPIMGQRLEIEGRHRDGTRFPLELTIWALDDGPQLSFNMLLHDISNRRRLEEELWELALVDDLTAVHNRRAFILLAEQAIKAAVRAKRPVIGVFVDVDGLKCINDTYGHAEGDRVLRLVADGLRSACREADIIGRLGGDEFAVLLAEATEISGLEARIRSRLDDARAGTLPAVSVSIGTARCEPDEDCHLDELFARADQAMYQDKLKRR